MAHPGGFDPFLSAGVPVLTAAACGRMLASMHTRDRWFTTLIAAVCIAAIAIALLSTVPTLVIIAGVGIALVAVALGADSIWDLRNRRHPTA